MTKNRIPIQQGTVKYKVSTGIQYDLDFEGYEACIAAGLDLERWAIFDYDRRFMIKVMAWFRLHNLISQHSNDAVARKQAADARKARRKKR